MFKLQEFINKKKQTNKFRTIPSEVASSEVNPVYYRGSFFWEKIVGNYKYYI